MSAYISSFLLIIFILHLSVSQKLTISLLDRLKKGGKVSVFVSFEDGIEPALRSFEARRDIGRSAGGDERTRQLEILRDSLLENMHSSQSDLSHFLAKRQNTNLFGTTKQFWITNQLFLEKADASILQEIAKDPKVSKIDEEGVIFIMQSDLVQKSVEKPSPGNIPWGIRKIQAPEAWSLSPPGTLGGEGVIVATIDTGVRHTHETLAANFLGDYGWYDPSKSQDTPFDILGHGTHVTATMAGRKGVGVAPGVKWASCAMCSKYFDCQPHYTLECGQFFVCPTLIDGSKPDCSQTPKVISNAWGTLMEVQWTEMIRVWHAAGIIPVFALGNSGPSCGSTFFPGNHSDVIAVGNTNFEDGLNLTSSVGPTTDGRIKPDIVAPGTDILSASVDGDEEYHVATGSSMSAPHVAGAIALLLGKQSYLTFEQVKTLLFQSAERDGLTFGEEACKLNTESVTFPNNLFGHGRLNVYEALKKLK